MTREGDVPPSSLFYEALDVFRERRETSNAQRLTLCSSRLGLVRRRAPAKMSMAGPISRFPPAAGNVRVERTLSQKRI